MFRDIAWNDGDFILDPGGRLTFVQDLDVTQQDLVARLTSPPGSHWAHPREGVDLPRFVQAATDELNLLELRQEVELEVARDRRVRRATADVTVLDLARARLTVRAELTDGALLQLGLQIGGNA